MGMISSVGHMLFFKQWICLAISLLTSCLLISAQAGDLPNFATTPAPKASSQLSAIQSPRLASFLPEPFLFPKEAQPGPLEAKDGLNREEWPAFTRAARASLVVDLAPGLPFKCPLLKISLGGEFSYFPGEMCLLFTPGSPLGRKSQMLVRVEEAKILFEPDKPGENGEIQSYTSSNYTGQTIRREGEKFVYEDATGFLRYVFFTPDGGTTWALESIGDLRVPGMRLDCEWSRDGILKGLKLPTGERWSIESSKGAPAKVTDPWGAVTELKWNERAQIKEITTSLPEWHPLYPKPKYPVAMKQKPFVVRSLHIESDADSKIVSLVNTAGEKFAVEYRADKDDKRKERFELGIMTLPDGTRRYCKTIWNLKGQAQDFGSADEGRVSKGAAGEDVFNSESHTEYALKSSVIVPSSETVNGRLTRYEYNAKTSVPTAKTGPDGARTEYETDDAGRYVAKKTGAQASIDSSYDKEGRLVKTVYGEGVAKNYSYADNAWMPSRVEEAGYSTEWKYDSSGRPTEASRDRVIYAFTWDSLCRMTSCVDPEGAKTTYSYVAGLRTPSEVAVATPSGGNPMAEKFEYDPCGRLAKRTLLDGSYREWTYSGGNITRTSENGQANTLVKTAYDAGNRKTLEVRPDGKWTFAYNAKGQLARMTGPDGKATLYEYDSSGLLVKKENPDGTWDAYVYDDAGRIVRTKNSKQEWQGTSYDLTGGVSAKFDSKGFGSETTRDSTGRIVEEKSTTPDGVVKITRYGYDSMGRKASVTYPDGHTMSYVYEDGMSMAVGTVTDGTMTWFRFSGTGKLLACAKLPYQLYLDCRPEDREALFAKYEHGRSNKNGAAVVSAQPKANGDAGASQR